MLINYYLVIRNYTNNYNLERLRMPTKHVTRGPALILGLPGKASQVSGVAAEAGRVSHKAKGSRMFKAARTAGTKILRPVGAWHT